MLYFKSFFVSILFTFSLLSSAEFTISSYNCGGLSDHYDYLRAITMEKLMQERYIKEPEEMATNEKIQAVALKMLFSGGEAKQLAEHEWKRNHYQAVLEKLIKNPLEASSPNASWYQQSDGMITNYQVRPVVIFDEEVKQSLQEHLEDFSKDEDQLAQLQQARTKMAQRIFQHHLKHDIICLQEADYLDESVFPDGYEGYLCETAHSVNGMVFRSSRFEFIKLIQLKTDRAFALQLLDKETNKMILVASGHLTGCDPYQVNKNEKGKNDSEKGDKELQMIVHAFDEEEGDIKIIGMDSNVTAVHPRLQILKNAGYEMDYENFLEPTCTNPNLLLNTRIDWITIKPGNTDVEIKNVPVLSVGLNNMKTNISDHKPIAATISYE